MSTIVIGLSIGMLLFLLASGLTVIFGTLGVVNFAHGAMYSFGAYLTWQAISWTNSFWLGLVFAPFIMAAVGFVFEILCLRKTYSRDHVLQLLVTFGLVLILDEAAKVIWGLDYKNVSTPSLLAGTWSVAGTEVAIYRLFVIAFGGVISFALFAVIDHSRAGMILRASETHAPMVRCLGIKVDSVRTTVFAVGSGLAALGGAIASPLLPIQPGAGFTIIIDSFLVVLIGGLGNIRGAIFSALAIGMGRALGQRWLPDWVDILTYAILVGVLILSPQGLFGRGPGRKG
ncbi:branched-chain amino acid ABC transporter permease [Paraburkholderia sp. IW21]|uniref:branched-chain amino acid ABC transporter permease n=1 Tax=Paraburkholderia sp. IW21 TaxID=3242488 RepID=UPI003521C4DB